MGKFSTKRIAVTGASGLIGSALVGHLKSQGHSVQRLVRRSPISPDEVQWDPQTGFVGSPGSFCKSTHDSRGQSCLAAKFSSWPLRELSFCPALFAFAPPHVAFS